MIDTARRLTKTDLVDETTREVVALEIRDLVRGTDDNLEKAALAMVSLHLGLVVDSADLVQEWRTRKIGQHAA